MWLISMLHKDGNIIGKDYDNAADCIGPLVAAVNSDDVVSIFCGRNYKKKVLPISDTDKPTHLIIYRFDDGDESISLRAYHPEALKAEAATYLLQVANVSTETDLSEILYINLKTGLTDYQLVATKENIKKGRRWIQVQPKEQ